MKNKILKNTTMLLIYNIAKLVFPFITLPYLTRIFTTDTYGTVAYVKTVMNYMQILIDFGFVLSATKEIVKIHHNKEKLEKTIGDTLIARLIMGAIGFLILIILCAILPILRDNILFTMLSYIAVFETIFLMDFLFRGLEVMHVITTRFIIMKIISTLLTFIFVKSDANLLLIPLLDIISTFIAIILVFYNIKKLNLKIKHSTIKKAISSLKESFVYFISNMASTSFNAFSTIIIGLYINKTEVAYWSVCMQIIGSIQACYTPISDGIYPEMIKTKNYNIIKKTVLILLPFVFLGCCLVYIYARFILPILGGQDYLAAVPILKLLIPALFFGFLSVLYGWPSLGAIGKEKSVTVSTIASVVIHILLLILLLITNNFTLINIAIVRTITEIVLFLFRFYYTMKNKHLFVLEGSII